MAPAADNNNLDLATKKAKLDSTTVNGGVGKFRYTINNIKCHKLLIINKHLKINYSDRKSVV